MGFGTTGRGGIARPFAITDIGSGFEPTLAGGGVDKAANEGARDGTVRDRGGAGDLSRRTLEHEPV